MKRDAIFASLDAILKSKVEHSILNSFDRINAFVEEFQELNNTLYYETTNNKADREKIFIAAKNYQQRKINRINNKYAEINATAFDIDPENLSKELRNLINKVPRKIKREQLKSRFYIVEEDVGIIRFVKKSKLLLFKLSKVPAQIGNLIRKAFNKREKRIKYWRYSIPFRKLVAFQIENNFIYRLTDILDDFIAETVLLIKKILDQEQKINAILLRETLPVIKSDFEFESLRFDYLAYQKDFKKNVNSYKRALRGLFEHYEDKIQELEKIAGTIEYSRIYLSYKNRKKNKDKVLKRFQNVNRGWGNTLFGLFEDWKIDQEIYNLNYFSRSKLDLVKSEFIESNKAVVSLIEKNRQTVSDFQDELIPKLSSKTSNHINIIRQELEELGNNSSKDNFEQSIELILNYNLPERINQFEVKIQNFLKEISDKRWLTKLTNYDTPIKQSDLSSFSPRELINFEYLPELRDSCTQLKFRIIQHVEKLQQDINNIEHVISFNLTSVIESIEREETKPDEVPTLASEGLERSSNKIGEIIESIGLFENEVLDELERIFLKFSDSVTQLTINENAFKLRILLAKAKTFKRTEDISEQLIRRFKALKQRAFILGKKFVIKVDKILLPWRKRIGLDKADVEIATELSDFLQEANQKINKLPLIYQRLYRISPLTEMSLFTGRIKEIDQLLHAYESWQQGKYSPTAIIGEKWSGHTTLVNYFINEHLDKKNILYENRYVNIKEESEFIDAWKTILNEKQIDSFEDIIQIILKKHKKKVIIIENIQNYYLRTFHGFENIHRLVKLVASTYKHVFWLISANMYAWNYLSKTVDLSGYFGYQIVMNAFNNDELKELIMKKNNISGYKINFNASEIDIQNKKFTRLKEHEQQEYLRSQFFNKLNGFAKGNISLALSYWLLSTKEISDEAIDIVNFNPPDFSFINKLDAAKVFVIYLLIMHDGLTLEQLDEVYKMPKDKLQMLIIMLHDDGILIEKNHWYEINPLIYRHCVNMLKSKNLIY